MNTPRRMLCLALLCILCGCTPAPPPVAPPENAQSLPVNVAPGMVFERDDKSGFQILDVDLQTANVRPIVALAHVERIRNNFVGDAKTVEEWASENQALGGINANFFGETYDTVGRRKQIVGLAVSNGNVIAPGDKAESRKPPRTRRVRSAFGVNDNGVPDIAWATGTLKGVPRKYPSPVDPDTSEVWRVRFAAACGPRLWTRGAKHLGDREEWLVDGRRASRAFVAYDWENNAPRHLVLGRADFSDYASVADYLGAYFARVHQSVPREAMCFDGGPSAQLVYRENGRLENAQATGVLVPTALLLVPQK